MTRDGLHRFVPRTTRAYLGWVAAVAVALAVLVDDAFFFLLLIAAVVFGMALCGIGVLILVNAWLILDSVLDPLFRKPKAADAPGPQAGSAPGSGDVGRVNTSRR